MSGADQGHTAEENVCFTLLSWTLPEFFLDGFVSFRPEAHASGIFMHIK